MATTNSTRPPSPTANAAPSKGNGKASSLTGFVLKLCNMVNGAPDDVVSWVPSGEAFRISDLSRLESETLPRYFRHSRFQSLVRQLNFYNFRKINRERTFWVYYHPLFHRDRPEDMPKLRRRTCPGFDGRRNRGGTGGNQSISPPPPSASITWSNEETEQATGRERSNAESNEEENRAPVGVASSPGIGVKVSRSPSPSSSPMAPPFAGNGSFRSLKSVISEEERSPYCPSTKNLSRQPSSLTSSFSEYGIAEQGQKKDFYRTDSVESVDTDNGYYGDAPPPSFSSVSLKPPTDPLQAEEYVVDQLNHHLGGFPTATKTKKSRKAKLDRTISSENESTADMDDSSAAHPHSSSTRKKYSREELQERQDHLMAVEDVSRRLNGICSDYADSISSSRPRSSSKKGSRGGVLGSNNAPGLTLRGTGCDAPVVFGLEKPHDHYYGPGKCDLLTYDGNDDFDAVDEGWGEKTDAPSTPIKAPKDDPATDAPPVTTTPPSQCPVVNQSLVRACMEGGLVAATSSTLERTLASAILSLCLSTHPQDADLAAKISAHLKRGPMLAGEFELYRAAMSPGSSSALVSTVVVDGIVRTKRKDDVGGPEELKRYWKTFSMNFMKRVAFVAHPEQRWRSLMTVAEIEAIERFVDIWFREIY